MHRTRRRTLVNLYDELETLGGVVDWTQIQRRRAAFDMRALTADARERVRALRAHHQRQETHP